MAKKYDDKKQQAAYDDGRREGRSEEKAKVEAAKVEAEAKEKGKLARKWEKLVAQGDPVTLGLGAVAAGGGAVAGFKGREWLSAREEVPEFLREHGMKLVGGVVFVGGILVPESSAGKAAGMGFGAGAIAGDVIYGFTAE